MKLPNFFSSYEIINKFDGLILTPVLITIGTVKPFSNVHLMLLINLKTAEIVGHSVQYTTWKASNLVEFIKTQVDMHADDWQNNQTISFHAPKQTPFTTKQFGAYLYSNRYGLSFYNRNQQLSLILAVKNIFSKHVHPMTEESGIKHVIESWNSVSAKIFLKCLENEKQS
jgi:hypothetical protein